MLGAGLLALAPVVSHAEADASDAAGTPADCHLVGIRIMIDDLNAAHRVCRHADGSTTLGPVEAVLVSAPPQTEAPTQYFPLDETSGG